MHPMQRFAPDRYYRTTDPALKLLGTPSTMAQWRHAGTGPRYVRLGGRVLYFGEDLNAYLDDHVVETEREPLPPVDEADMAGAS